MSVIPLSLKRGSLDDDLLTDMQSFTLFLKDKFMNVQWDEQTNEEVQRSRKSTRTRVKGNSSHSTWDLN